MFPVLVLTALMEDNSSLVVQVPVHLRDFSGAVYSNRRNLHMPEMEGIKKKKTVIGYASPMAPTTAT